MANKFLNSENMEEFLISNEVLIKSILSVVFRNETELMLDKKKRIYFVGSNFTVNLVPQIVLLLGLLGCKHFQ